MPRRRRSLTTSGTTPLGEGGTRAALIVASATSGEETVVIESMASASSINQVLTARSLSGGIDPVDARRILTERDADRSGDYAALLDSLVRSTAGSPARSNRLAEELTSSLGGPCTIGSRQDEFALGYRTMRSWLANRLQAYLSAIDLSTALDRVDEEYDRVDRTEPRRAGTRSARTSCNGMAALGH